MRYLLIVILWLAPRMASGTTYDWQGTDGSWNESSNWSPTSVPGTSSGNGDQVEFTATGGSPVDLDINGDVAYLNSINFISTAITAITNTSGTSSIVLQTITGNTPTIQVSGTSAGAITISPPLTLQDNLTITQGDTTHSLTLGSFTEFGGSFGVTVVGPGTTVFSGTSTYSNATVVSNGATLQAGSTSAFSPNSAFTLTGSVTLDLQGNDNTIASLAGTSTATVCSTVGPSTLTINNGGSFAGTITDEGGPLGLNLAGGTLVLANNNTFTGDTSVASGSILQLKGLGQISTEGTLTLDGAFDISAITTTANIGNLAGSGTVTLGGKELVVNMSTDTNFFGNISGTNGSLKIEGGHNFTLSGPTSYTGATTVPATNTMTADGSNFFAPESAFTVDGTLDLGEYSNTINTLSGTGTVTLGTSDSTTLTVANGGNFSGGISGSGGLTLNAGTLNLSGTNDYAGSTTIGGGTLAVVGNGALSSATTVTANGTFDISGLNASSQAITDLSGNGVVNLGNNTLVVTSPLNSTFNGTITGAGGSFDYEGSSTFTLGVSGSNYTGTTTVGSSGTLQAGVANAFAPGSTYVVNGILQLNGYATTLAGLSGAGTVDTGAGALLTLTGGGSFSGGITGSGGLALTGGTLNLTGSTNSYSGTTTVFGANTILAYGTSSALSSSSAIILSGGATLRNVGTFSTTIPSLNGDNTSSVDLGTGGILTITNGGTFAGVLSNTGNLQLNGGTLVLSNTNSFTGTATIFSGATLRLTGSGNIANAGSLSLAGTLDITAINSFTNINNLQGYSGSILLGSNALVIKISGSQLCSANISGVGGSLILQGTDTLYLLGNNSYTGATHIISATLLADSLTALAAQSDFTVDGTLDLGSYSNTIKSLSGSGIVQSSMSDVILTIANGGNFSGNIQGSIGLAVTGGTLTLGSGSSYTGATTIATNAVLSAAAANVFSSNSATNVWGALNLHNLPNTIFSLTGAGRINTGTATAEGILTITNGGEFSGGIKGLGGVTLNGGTLTLSTTIAANTYTGPTLIRNGATLQAGGTNAFSAGSAHTLLGGSYIDLNGFNNAISSLNGDNTSVLDLNGAVLNLNGAAAGCFAGQITDSLGGSGGLTISGGSILVLSGGSNDYSGATTIVNGNLRITASGALSPNTAVTIAAAGELDVLSPANTNAAVSIVNGGILSTQELVTLSSTYTQSSGGSLIIGLDNDTGNFGQISAATGISLNGSLNLNSTESSPSTGFFHLLTTSSGTVVGEFSSFTSTGFTTTPHLSYSLQSVDLFFSSCSNGWTYSGNGVWNDGTNWGSGSESGCVPGVNGNLNDVATFTNLAADAITVTLTNITGNIPQPVTLVQLNLNASTTGYTISQYSDASTITFDAESGGTPTINVIAGIHEIDAPLLFNQSSALFLSDGATLTLGANTTLLSATKQALTIKQSSSSTVGTGLLINEGSVTPYTLTMSSASLENNNVIAPLTSLTVGGISGQVVTISNSGANAQIGSSARSGSLMVGGEGTTYITNDGTAAVFGPTGSGSSMVIGSTGSTIITNNGIGAILGPTGSGSSLSVEGAGTTVITNSGFGVVFGAIGSGGSVSISSGSITNRSGALIQAGANGILTINGGSITNDTTSKVGTPQQNLLFTAGSLETSGDILAFNYVQNGSSILQLNVTSLPAIYGNVAASGTATIGSTLVINALPDSITVGQSIDLITAEKGILGTYDTINYLNFPAGIIPQIIYLPNAVELVTSNMMTSHSVGSFSQLSFTSANETNLLVQRDIHTLTHTIRKRKPRIEREVDFGASLTNQVSPAEGGAEIVKVADFALEHTYRQEHLLTERVSECLPNPSRVYMGPIDSFGSFTTKSVAQTGFGFNAVGLYTGIEHAFEDFGVGFAAQYTNTKGHLHNDSGHLTRNQLQGNAYATWLAPCMQALSVEGILGYGYDWWETGRNAGSPLDAVYAKGNTQGMVVNALLGVEYFFAHEQFCAMPCNLYVTPLLNLQYIWSRIAGYDEDDPGAYALHVDTQRAHSLKTTLGARLEYLVECTNFTCKPELDLGWQFEYLDHQRNVYLSTMNAPTDQVLANPVVGAGRNTLLVGVDFFFTICKIFELEMSYDFQWNDLYNNNTFYLGIGGNF